MTQCKSSNNWGSFQFFLPVCKIFITNVSHQFYNVSVKVEKIFLDASWSYNNVEGPLLYHVSVKVEKIFLVIHGHATMLRVHYFITYP